MSDQGIGAAEKRIAGVMFHGWSLDERTHEEQRQLAEHIAPLAVEAALPALEAHILSSFIEGLEGEGVEAAQRVDPGHDPDRSYVERILQAAINQAQSDAGGNR